MIRKYPIALIFATLFGSLGVAAQTKGTITIKVYFHNEKLNPNMLDCTKFFATERTIPKTRAVARAALDELFKGTTEGERKREFSSAPPEDTRDIIRGLSVKDGVAYLNFKKSIFEKLGNTTSSCGSGFYSSIEATLKQFKSIKKVVYAVEGNANDFYDWVQVGDCPHGRHCNSKNFTFDN